MGFLYHHIYFGADAHRYYHLMSPGGVGKGNKVAAPVGDRRASSTPNAKK